MGCQWKGDSQLQESAEERKPLPGQSVDDLKKPLAIIDGRTIAVSDLQKRINQQSPFLRARYSSPVQKKELLESMIRFEVLAREAEKRGYDRDPEVLRMMKEQMIARLMKETFSNKVKIEDISDDECRRYYDSHQAEFQRPDEVRASHILVKDQKIATKVAADLARKSTASTGGERVIDPTVFRTLVTQYSQDEVTKGVGGDLSFFAKDASRVAPEVVQAAFALKDVGSFTKTPVEANDGLHFLVLTGKRAAMNRSFDEVRRQIQNTLYWEKRKQAMEDYVNDLKGKAKVDIHEANLAKVVVDTAAATNAPAVPAAPPSAPAAPSPHSQGKPEVPSGHP